MLLTEGGLQLRVENLRHKGQWHRAGSLIWSNNRGPSAGVDFKVAEYLHEAEVVLTYRANGRPMEQKIACEPTEQYPSGRRWWFLCPGCNRRMGVLYLSPGRSAFRCRGCYGLRYRSQQRDLDFLLKPLAAAAGVPRRIARKYLYEAPAMSPKPKRSPGRRR
jgi:hypothetical protein